MIRRSFVAGAAATFALLGPASRARADAYATGSFAVPGGNLGYRRFGDKGPVYVLLSGGPGLEPAYVDPVAVELARDRTVVVLDQRGTGTSREALGDGSALTVAGAVADLDGLREALGLRRLSLLGHSWGAMLSMAYAAAHGDRVASLALLDPGGPDPTFFKGFGERIGARLTAADNAAALAAQQANSADGVQRAILPGFFYDHAKGLAFQASLPQHFANSDVNRTMYTDVAAHYDVTKTLSGTTIPTLLLYGSNDPSRVAEAQLDTLFPHATKVMVADSGHFPWLENPTPFYAAMRAFLNGAPAPA
jgi:proline iminopeptidase